MCNCKEMEFVVAQNGLGFASAIRVSNERYTEGKYRMKTIEDLFKVRNLRNKYIKQCYYNIIVYISFLFLCAFQVILYSRVNHSRHYSHF